MASRPEPIETDGKPVEGVLTEIGHCFALERLM